MNDYLEIFSDVVLLATFQPRWGERFSSAPRAVEPRRNRTSRTFRPDRRSNGPQRI